MVNQSNLIAGVGNDNQPRAIRVSDEGSLSITGEITTSIGLTDAELRAAAVPVSSILTNESGDTYGVKQVDGKPCVSSMPYTYDIAEGNVTDHVAWSIFGYTPVLGLAESDIWSASGQYVFPVAAQQMELVSSDNAQDIGVSIKGDATGNTVQSDPDGSLTTLTDADVDFTAATAVAIGDIIILDPHGISPSFGFVTGVAAHTLTVADGFAKGASGASRYYAVIDKSAHTGALVVGVKYLDASYACHGELVVLNGTTPVDTINTNIFRVNDMRVIGTGTGNKPVGNISIRNTAGTTTYDYITLGYNVARGSFYTVPAEFTLYITQVTFAFGYAANQTHYARLYLRSNRDPASRFHMGSIFYPDAGTICANSSTVVQLTSPIKYLEHSDVKASGFASTATGIATVAMRGWLEKD